jgi:hypothetical protein
LSTDSNDGNCHAFTTLETPDYFTEVFEGGDNDFDNLSITLWPDGSDSFYRACTEEITAFPTDPSGGNVIGLDDDDYGIVPLSGVTVLLYGHSYGDSAVYVGSNGYLTFTAGDSDWSETLADHFDLPRISPLFDDLDPSSGGSVSWKQLADRIAVTWENLPEYGTFNSNSFQVEMFFDGKIRITWLAIAAINGLAGLSEGDGVPGDFLESDLSAYGSCGPSPPTAHDMSVNTQTNVPAEINLPAFDDGLPDPPSVLTYRILSLPSDGNLSDPCAGAIISVPYVLAGGGSTVTYTPDSEYEGPDIFTFDANDGGIVPNGGVSNVATVSITVTDCRPAEPNTPNPPNGTNDVPAETILSWNGAQQSSSSVDVLMLSTGGDPANLRTGLTAYSEINTADYLDADQVVPTLADLAAYDVVVTMSNDIWPDATATGDVLADYVDAGGRVIQSWESFATGGNWELAGRFVTAGVYEPFTHGGLDVFFPSLNLGSFDADHPIMEGVTALGDWFIANIGLQPGAVWVADWDNGYPVVATRGNNVVGINIAAYDDGAYTGDVALLYRNAVVWLVESTQRTTYDVYLGAENPPTELICSDVNEPNCNPGPLELCTPYYWQVKAKNYCDQTLGEIWSFTTESYPGDFEPDCDVDFADVAVMAEQWLQTPGSPSADIAPSVGDGIVNFLDFAKLTENWMK